ADLAVAMQVRCVDAAREAARLAARGDERAVDVARRIAPGGAAVRGHRGGGFLFATVIAHSKRLPRLDNGAKAGAGAVGAGLSGVTGAGAYLGLVVVARRRAQAAADLAALAAAARAGPVGTA